jgi:cell division protein ZapE
MNLSMRGSGAVNARYAAKIASGEIEPDNAQADVVEELAQLDQALTQHQLARKSSGLSWIFGGRNGAAHALRGLYIYGEVGRGKTMLMDLFFSASAVSSKRRVHFHEFMAEVHERIHALRQEIKAGTIKDREPIAQAATAISRDSSLLCFDEFHVTDIADAMILGRLFARLFELGVVVVATSNLPPRELYREGLNRDLFLAFIALIEEHMKVVRLAARTDFRLEKLGGAPVWHVPANAASARALDTIWARLTAGQSAQERHLIVKGRAIRVPKAADGVARFSFHDLCEEPLAAGDYLKIAHEFHTVLIDAIPVMDYAHRNEAKRFIILIDTFYDNAVKLVASAAAEPVALYTANDGYEAYEFKRTASRLIEMRSPSYLSLPHGPSSAAQAHSVAGLVET